MSGTCQGTINITIPCTPNWTGGAWSACQSNVQIMNSFGSQFNQK